MATRRASAVDVGGAREARCGSCGQRILWATNTITGKPIPLNRTRVRTYHVHAGRAEVQRDAVGVVQLAYTSHFTTCPNAAEHSKGDRRQT